MSELWSIVSFTVKGFYCRIVGHRWLDLVPHAGTERICLRCMLHESVNPYG